MIANPTSDQFFWEIAGLTDAGPERARNEDAIAFDDAGGLMVLADGMGGRPAGDVASSLAVAEVMTYLGKTLAANARRDAPTLKRWLDEACTEANAKVFATAEMDRATRGMGTTIVAAVLAEGHACIAHVGDSRAYLATDDGLRALTRDHTTMGERIEIGLTKEDYFGQIKRRSSITRALGVNSIALIDTMTVKMKEGDVLMLASDGLFEPIPDPELADILKKDLPLATMAAQLVGLAIRRGSDDNLSVILARKKVMSDEKPRFIEGNATLLLPTYVTRGRG